MEEIEEERERYLTVVKNPKALLLQDEAFGDFFFFF